MSEPIRDPDALGPAEIGPHCLVTGGRGYLGSRLAERLRARGCRVRTFDLAPPRGLPGIDEVVGDVRLLGDLEAACEGVDTVFHTVATINLLALYRPEVRRAVFDVNVHGTDQVLRACRRADVGRLVHTSTINVAMGSAVRDGDEDGPTVKEGDLLDLYGETKALAERRVLEGDTKDGLRTLALRAAGIWGPGDGCLMISTFVEQLALGRFKVLVGDGHAVLDNVHIENLVDAHLLAAVALGERPARVGGHAYFVTDGEPMNGVEWFRPLVEGLGHRWPRLRVPAWLMLRVGFLLELVHYLGGPPPTLTRRGVLNLTRDASFRIDRARADLGYQPRVLAREGLPALLPHIEPLHRRVRDAR